MVWLAWVVAATAMVAARAGMCPLGVYDERGLNIHGRVATTESTVWWDGAGMGEAAPDKGLRWRGVRRGVSEALWLCGAEAGGTNGSKGRVASRRRGRRIWLQPGLRPAYHSPRVG